jgi:lipopolysaccharide transport system ATP-binding protein
MESSVQTPEESFQNNEVILSVEKVSKKFCRSLKNAYIYGLKDITAEIFGISRKSEILRANEFWALRDVSLELRRGESVGLIGVNGSGKTTLMRIIAGILKPDAGSARIKGRLAALNVLGAGFNPILSGRENVYINMSILGLSKREIDRNFQNVLDFAEIWDAIDSPVRTYSSGMRARLGFSCAIYTNPDILLIDEVLAVGDFSFRTKCYRKLSELRKNGVSFVLVSHSTSSILSTCDSAIYIAKGKIVTQGTAREVVKKYEEDLSLNKDKSTEADLEKNVSIEQFKAEKCELKIQSLSFHDAEENLLKVLITGQPAYLYIQCDAQKDFKDVSINLIVRSLSDRQDSYLSLSSANDIGFTQVSQGKFMIKLLMPYCGLLTGIYSLKLNITHNGHYYTILDIIESFKFEVRGDENFSQSSFYQPRNWKIESQ